MRFIRAGVTSNEAPAAERVEKHLSIFIKRITHITFTLWGQHAARPRAEGNE